MTDKRIKEMTLECLMNKESYEKYRLQSSTKINVSNTKDKKFYRKRIYDLTKKLLIPSVEKEKKEEKETIISPDIKYSFEVYVKACVEYFKMIDKTDIIQEDYNGLLDLDPANEIKVDNIQTSEQADQLMMRAIKIREPNNLEKLVKRRSLKPANTVIPPQQKEINLKDPVLKNKGIRKKKNIINTYDQSEDKTGK